MRPFALTFGTYLLLNTVATLSWAEEVAPYAVVSVARQQMLLRGKPVVFAEPGSILSVFEKKDDKLMVQAPSGQRAWVLESSTATLREAEKVFNDLIRKKPKEPSVYLLRANYWAYLSQHEKAIADSTRALSLGAENPSIYFNRGVFHAMLEKYDAAIRDYTQAIKNGDAGTTVLENRSAAYLAKKDIDAAMRDYNELIRREPKNADYYVRRGVAWRRQENFGKAIEDFSSAMKLDPSNQAAISSRGFVHYLQGEHAKAVEDFALEIKLDPKSALAHNNRGFNRQMIGDYRGALADYDKAMELDPRYPMAYQNAAWLLATCSEDSCRDGKKSLEIAKKLCEMREYQEYSDIKALAAAHAELGDFKQAVARQKEAIGKMTAEDKSAETEILKLYQTQQPYRVLPK